MILCWQKRMVILCWHRILPISALSPFAIQAFITLFRIVAKKGRKLNNKSRLSGFAVVNYHLQSGEKKRLIGVCTVCVSTLSCPASCLAWNSLYAWSERTRPNMAEQRAELISFTPASTLQLGDGGGGGVGDGLGLPPRPCLRISQI